MQVREPIGAMQFAACNEAVDDGRALATVIAYTEQEIVPAQYHPAHFAFGEVIHHQGELHPVRRIAESV